MKLQCRQHHQRAIGFNLALLTGAAQAKTGLKSLAFPMRLTHRYFDIQTEASFQILDLTSIIQQWIDAEQLTTAQLTLTGQHTTTALLINENEPRLLQDIQRFLETRVPAGDRYLHNDLHLRDVPEDEPINAHSHLMAMLLETCVTLPIVAGRLGLGTYQSVLLVELDGPRSRRVLAQLLGS